MFTQKDKTKPGLDKAIDELLKEMSALNGDSEEYAKMVTQLNTLYRLKEVDPPKTISPDTLAIVAGNLLGIVMIVGHERAHVITSKAIGFILKMR